MAHLAPSLLPQSSIITTQWRVQTGNSIGTVIVVAAAVAVCCSHCFLRNVAALDDDADAAAASPIVDAAVRRRRINSARAVHFVDSDLHNCEHQIVVVAVSVAVAAVMVDQYHTGLVSEFVLVASVKA